MCFQTRSNKEKEQQRDQLVINSFTNPAHGSNMVPKRWRHLRWLVKPGRRKLAVAGCGRWGKHRTDAADAAEAEA